MPLYCDTNKNTFQQYPLSEQLLETLSWEENDPQVLVLEPTRELLVQVQEAIFYIRRSR